MRTPTYLRVGKYCSDGVYEYQCLSCRSTVQVRGYLHHHCRFCWDCGIEFTAVMLHKEPDRIYVPWEMPVPQWLVESRSQYSDDWEPLSCSYEAEHALTTVRNYREDEDPYFKIELRIRRAPVDPLPLP